jgi:hypothetical protein
MREAMRGTVLSYRVKRVAPDGVGTEVGDHPEGRKYTNASMNITVTQWDKYRLSSEPFSINSAS